MYKFHIFELRNDEIQADKIIAVEDAACAAAKRKPEKFRLAGIQTLTNVIPVDRSNQLS